ncbi:hypothetical protein [Anaerotruncus sp. G3(2012)]|nr:hypothetical protein [Anaerotruncus sp. G3(2012)]
MKCCDCRPPLRRCRPSGCRPGCLPILLIAAGILLLSCVLWMLFF